MHAKVKGGKCHSIQSKCKCPSKKKNVTVLTLVSLTLKKLLLPRFA